MERLLFLHNWKQKRYSKLDIVHSKLYYLKQQEVKGIGMKLDNNLRRLRFEHGEMSQQALAERIGVTRMTVYSIETGRYVPSTVLALKLARVFGIEVEEIFSLREEATVKQGGIGS